MADMIFNTLPLTHLLQHSALYVLDAHLIYFKSTVAILEVLNDHNHIQPTVWTRQAEYSVAQSSNMMAVLMALLFLVGGQETRSEIYRR